MVRAREAGAGDLPVGVDGGEGVPAVLPAQLRQKPDRVFVAGIDVGPRFFQVADGKACAAYIGDLLRLAHLHAEPAVVARRADVPALAVVGHTAEDAAVVHHVVDHVLGAVAVPEAAEHPGVGLGRADGVEHHAPGAQRLRGGVAAGIRAEGVGDRHWGSSFCSQRRSWRTAS